MNSQTATAQGQQVIDNGAALMRLYRRFKAGGISREQYIRQVREISGR